MKENDTYCTRLREKSKILGPMTFNIANLSSQRSFKIYLFGNFMGIRWKFFPLAHRFYSLGKQ